MMTEYYLMHKEVVCGIIIIDSISGNLLKFKSLVPEHTPFLGHANNDLMKKWWQARAIPGTRDALRQILKSAGCETNLEYMAKNLALSITDMYWICPIHLDLSWEQVNLYNWPISHSAIPYHNASSYSPDATLGGQMDKYWDMKGTIPVLVKTAYREFGQQSINEEFATLVHERQPHKIPFVRYSTGYSVDGGVFAKCNIFTSFDKEFVSAFECINSEKHRKSESLYEKYISICTQHGIDQQTMQDYMDYQTLTDFVLSNTDEHLMNYGVLRDPVTLAFIAPAPVFDTGNSMFYNEHGDKPYSRYQILRRKVTGLFDYEERYLSHVKNRKIVDIDALPSLEETVQFYEAHHIPEEKAEFIAGCYAVKLALLHKFQSGHKISAYLEKSNE